MTKQGNGSSSSDPRFADLRTRSSDESEIERKLSKRVDVDENVGGEALTIVCE